jgi:hypothetical protein
VYGPRCRPFGLRRYDKKVNRVSTAAERKA